MNAEQRQLRPPPFWLRIAAILCAGVGFYGFLTTVAVSARLGPQHIVPWFVIVAPPLGALLIFIAGVLLWLRRRLGIVLLLAGCALPLVNHYAGGPVRSPNVLLVPAAVLIVANVRRLR